MGMMEKKMVIVVALVLFVISSHTDGQGIDCYDSCSTGCVNRNTRLYLRCDRKCRIRCGPDLKAYEQRSKTLKASKNDGA